VGAVSLTKERLAFGSRLAGTGFVDGWAVRRGDGRGDS